MKRQCPRMPGKSDTAREDQFRELAVRIDHNDSDVQRLGREQGSLDGLRRELSTIKEADGDDCCRD